MHARFIYSPQIDLLEKTKLSTARDFRLRFERVQQEDEDVDEDEDDGSDNENDAPAGESTRIDSQRSQSQAAR